LGIDISPQQRSLLEQFEGWLVTEAQTGGGLGPREHLRVFDRHIADSLGFLRGLSGTPDPGRLVDVGSGVGLPGIPLAIMLPTTHVTLLDRSGRRVELARRATRVLGLHNVETVQADVNAVDQVFDVVTFRASLPIVEATMAFLACSSPGGIGLVGVSRRDAAPQIPAHPAGVGYALTAEGMGVLDSPFWLLRMQRI
jgi:16S rRNA (guanine527-N7)-methyltransferase